MVFFLRIVDNFQDGSAAAPASSAAASAAAHTTTASSNTSSAQPGPKRGYRCLMDGPRAVFHEGAQDPTIIPTEQPRLLGRGKGDTYVVPCGGLLELAGADHFQQVRCAQTMASLIGSVQEAVAERRNVTVVNRGTPGAGSNDYFATLTTQVVQAVGSSAERAIQIVADEIAKERQMQRLLASDDEVSSTAQLAPKPPSTARPQTSGSATDGGGAGSFKKAGLELSPAVRSTLRTMSAQREALSPTRQGGFNGTMRASTSHGARASRFSLLAAGSEGELYPPSSGTKDGLTPRAFIARPPDLSPTSAARRATMDANAAAKANAAQRRNRRRSTAVVLEKLQNTAENPMTVQPIKKGNGWGTELRHFQWNGSSSVMILPAIPKLEEFIKAFTIDFWVKTDCRLIDGKRLLLHLMEGQRAEVGMLFQLGLNWHPEFGEDHIRLYLRDSGNRVMECVAPLPMGFTTGQEFHHIMVRIKNLETGKLEIFFDGQQTDRIRFLQQEHPAAFESWQHRLFVGSYMDDNHSVQNCLRGSICELRLWKGALDEPILRWPLHGERNVFNKLVEATHHVSEDHPETLNDLRETINVPPIVCPYFDGNLAVNLGTMGVLGELLFNWSVEIRFRTNVTNRSMSLLGVTDSQHKMAEIGIVLNAEPVLSRERYRFHEHHVTLYLVDSLGAAASVLLRGSDRQNLMDNEWHTLHWKVVDSETNKFEVRVDGVAQDVLQVYRDGPKNFEGLIDFVCLGGHNIRSWKIKNTFQGHIKSCQFHVRGEPISALDLNEGPGGSILQDSTGQRNHGVLLDASNNKQKRIQNVMWVPCNDFGEKEPQGGADGAVTTNVVIHKNNVVSFAAVRFGVTFDATGTTVETTTDVVAKKTFELRGPTAAEEQAQAAASAGISSILGNPTWGSWQRLPETAFHRCDSLNQLKELAQSVVRGAAWNDHLLVVIRVGDCCVSLLDLTGPLVPPFAMFDTNMLKWKYAISINGTKGRREQVLNNAVVGLERMLCGVSMNPNVALRLGPQNQQEAGDITAMGLMQTLQNNGLPWRLPLVVHGLLLNTEFASYLHIVHSCFKVSNEDDVAAITLVNTRVQRACDTRAAVLIQRNWRARMARTRVGILEDRRRSRKQQVEEILSLRRANPLVQPKKNLRAIIITLHEYTNEAIPPIQSNKVQDLIDPLKRQGYHVDHIVNPTRAVLLKTIGSIDPDSCAFLYISGYGGSMRVKGSPSWPLLKLHVSMAEGTARANIQLDATIAFNSLMRQAYAAMYDVLSTTDSKGAKKGTGGGKAAAGGGRGAAATAKSTAVQTQQMRHVEETFRMAREELVKEESESRTLKMMKEYDLEVGLLQREFRQALNVAQDFEDMYRRRKPAPMNGLGWAGRNEAKPLFLLTCDCRTLEPQAQDVLNVDDIIHRALQRQLPPMGLQAVVAIDLVPLAPCGQGGGILAASTGHTFEFGYGPEQRHLLSWQLRKAYAGYLPKVAMRSKEAILLGAVETPDTQRDWRSFATYLVTKMIVSANDVNQQEMIDTLSAELPYTADLVPVRSITATSDVKDRARRDLESRRAQAHVVFAVDSLKVVPDMSAEFRSFLQHVTLTETVNLQSVLLSFMHENRGIDGLRADVLEVEVERCAPSNTGGDVKYEISIQAQGALITFTAGEKQKISQWMNTLASRSIAWRLPTSGVGVVEGSKAGPMLEVDRAEMMYLVKASGTMKKIKSLLKQRNETPLPYPTIRFVSCQVVAE